MLQESSKLHASDYLEGLLDQMPESQRWALLKLVTGGPRVGVSARMARLALSKSYEIEVDEIEQIWPLIQPPYLELFNWLEGKADKPDAKGKKQYFDQ